MMLKAPFEISSRLLPSVKVGGAVLSLEPKGRADRMGKPGWVWYIDFEDGREFTGSDLHGWGDTREMMGSLLTFLGACGESVNYRDRTGREGENADLFPAEVGAWAAQFSDEISMLALEIEEASDCVQD